MIQKLAARSCSCSYRKKVSGTRGSPPRKTNATSRSFQTQMNWKMANEVAAARPRVDHDAPEQRPLAYTVDPARLDQGRGSPMKKSRLKKTPKAARKRRGR